MKTLAAEVCRGSSCSTVVGTVFPGISLPAMRRTASLPLSPSRFLWKACAASTYAAAGALLAVLPPRLCSPYHLGPRARGTSCKAAANSGVLRLHARPPRCI